MRRFSLVAIIILCILLIPTLEVAAGPPGKYKPGVSVNYANPRGKKCVTSPYYEDPLRRPKRPFNPHKGKARSREFPWKEAAGVVRAWFSPSNLGSWIIKTKGPRDAGIILTDPDKNFSPPPEWNPLYVRARTRTGFVSKH